MEEKIMTDAELGETRINEELRLQLQAELREKMNEFIAELVDKYINELPSAKAVKEVKLKYDSIGKVIQSAEGNGTFQDPFKTWQEGTPVKVGEWWMTHDGYLWEVIKDGTPSSSTDKEYWDVVGI